MKTLIELFDQEPIYNYLAATVFEPDRVCFLGDYESLDIDVSSAAHEYAQLVGLDCSFSFSAADSDNYDEMRRKLKELIRRETEAGNECFIDVTGGRDLALVAAGSLIPYDAKIVYYDRSINAFRHLGEERLTGVDIGLSCDAFITIAGGTVYSDSRNKKFTDEEWEIIRRVIGICFKNRDVWNRFIKYLQKVAKGENERVADDLNVDAVFSFDDGDGKTFRCHEEIMRELAAAGIIEYLRFSPDKKRVRFSFINREMAILLVNEGVWLELAVYLAGIESEKFFDVQSSVKFVWDIPSRSESLEEIVDRPVPRNEVDVVLTRGVLPVFVSCKTRMPTNDDLNELYALRKKFGGELAAAVLATTKSVDRKSPIWERAEEMQISIIDERYFENGTVMKQLEKVTELK